MDFSHYINEKNKANIYTRNINKFNEKKWDFFLTFNNHLPSHKLIIANYVIHFNSF